MLKQLLRNVLRLRQKSAHVPFAHENRFGSVKILRNANRSHLCYIRKKIIQQVKMNQ